MRGKQFLTRKVQFDAVYQQGRAWTDRELIGRFLPNGLDITRYGFTVSCRVGKAVIRNRVKRRLREIMVKTELQPGWDIVFVARPAAGAVKYAEMNKSVRTLLSRAGVILREHESISPGTH